MRAPRLSPVRRRLGVLLVVVLALLAGLAGQSPSTYAASRRSVDGPRPDAPVMPANCFGPAQTSGEPRPCHLNTFQRQRPTIVLWGDSHAWQYIPALTDAVKRRGVNLVTFVAGTCPPIEARKNPPGGYSGKCERNNAKALTYVTRLIRRGSKVKVVLGSNWSGFRIAYRRVALEDSLGIDSGLEDYTEKMVRLSHERTPRLFVRLGQLGAHVDVVAQSAVVPDRSTPCDAGDDFYRCDVPRWRALREEGRTRSWLMRQIDHLEGRTRYIDPTKSYCNAAVCHGEIGSISTWYDRLHLSATRTRHLASYFSGTVKSAKHLR